ncbi:UDP-N-acetylmuramate--L-alanine ligase [Candidatus Sumerlaeota bacterium]|nr:UDP-N-acetylmuramate--L-alanine ligase [Candidatus Sumerlaeota bacterium]
MFQSKRVHFIGIGGAGMSAIAWVLLQKGIPVSGSDLYANSRTLRLEQNGARIFYSHDPDNLKDVGLVVFSSAITDDNPEIIQARRMKLPLWHRSAMLAELLEEGESIAVAGTHGKTTTTAMVSMILERAGENPTVLIGGEVTGWERNAKLGSGKYIVAEADESDGTLLSYFPTYAIITNVESDHLDFYKNYDAVKKLFDKFLNQAQEGGCAILCADDPGIRSITRLSTSRGRSFYSLIAPECEYFADDVVMFPGGSSFTFCVKGEKIGKVRLSIPGRHNVSNALASLALGHKLGVDFSSMKNALENFHGAKRRFQIKGEVDHVMIVDDYAHHPTEVASTLSGAIPLVNQRGGRLITVFQPHRFTRTQAFYREFSRAFDDSDIVIITDVYSAGEEPIEGVSGEMIYNSLIEKGRENAYYIPDIDNICDMLTPLLIPGDLVITMGAGNIWKIGETLLKNLESHDIKSHATAGAARI